MIGVIAFVAATVVLMAILRRRPPSPPARTDALTGLPDRAALVAAADAAMLHGGAGQAGCAMLMIDLDRFKAVNDRLGHPIGDRLLAGVAERLTALTGDHGVCGRLGGDEFLVIIRDAVDLGWVDDLAQAVIDRLSEPFSIESREVLVGASVGTAVAPCDGDSFDSLMGSADLALYQAKSRGGGRFCRFEPALRADADERHRLEQALCHALDRDEFRLELQPVVETAGETVACFAAALRWTSSELGDVAPGLFMPLAEASGLIAGIGDWMLHRACRQAMLWPCHVRVAVPVSAEQLIAADFYEAVVHALAMAGLPPQRLEIEVPDGIFQRDPDAALLALERVTALGCAVALKDFGTGNSSLADIRKLRCSTLKLHRSFVATAAAGNRESLAVIRAIAALADSLDMMTTAEGVDTERERELARNLGCRRIQGGYYGEPMRAEDTVLLFDQQQRRFA